MSGILPSAPWRSATQLRSPGDHGSTMSIVIARLRNWMAGATRGASTVVVVHTPPLYCGWASYVVTVVEHGLLGTPPPAVSAPVNGSAGSHAGGLSGIRPTCSGLAAG